MRTFNTDFDRSDFIIDVNWDREELRFEYCPMDEDYVGADGVISLDVKYDVCKGHGITPDYSDVSARPSDISEVKFYDVNGEIDHKEVPQSFINELVSYLLDYAN